MPIPPPYIDLHLHSNCSDGRLSPAEVVACAVREGLAAIALADHDNIDGLEPALQAAAGSGLEVVSGVELSVIYGSHHDIHLLGYGFDRHHAGLVAVLEESRRFRETRNERIVENINLLLCRQGREPLLFPEVRALAGGTVGRPHIGLALLAAGYVKSMEEAFQAYLTPCNVEKRQFPIAEAIEILHAAGGVAILAHPPFITRDRYQFLGLLGELTEFGLDGIEAYNSGAGPQETAWYLTEAHRRGLLVTGGSDFHGLEKESARIGFAACQQRIPYRCLQDLRDRLGK